MDLQAIRPWLEEPEEQTVGTHIAVSHCAATPAGLTVTVRVKLVRVEGRQLEFEVHAHDGVDVISEGTHRRQVIRRTKFLERVARKAQA